MHRSQQKAFLLCIETYRRSISAIVSLENFQIVNLTFLMSFHVGDGYISILFDALETLVETESELSIHEIADISNYLVNILISSSNWEDLQGGYMGLTSII